MRSDSNLPAFAGRLQDRQCTYYPGETANYNQQWQISFTTHGSYKIANRASINAGTDLVMCMGLTVNEDSDGVNVLNSVYEDNESYRDEWVLIYAIYGSQKYREVSGTSINCHGYAMMRSDSPEDWHPLTNAYLNTVPVSQTLGNNDYSQTIRNTVSEKTKLDFENWLNEEEYNWIYEDSFTDNGDYMELDANQYRVVLRTGLHNFTDGIVIIRQYDYHFWYQTFDGRWANKHGDSDSELLPVSTTPYTSGSSGWALGSYEDFYNGIIYSYIITVD